MLFYTGLMTSDYEYFRPFPYPARTWTVDLVDGPRVNGFSQFRAYRDGRHIDGKEIVIEAKNIETAKRAFALIAAAKALLDGSSFFGPGDDHMLLAPAEARSRDARDQGRDRIATANFPWACGIATKATSRNKYVYALNKWRLSTYLVSVPFIELDPSYSETIERTPDPQAHVLFSYAIIAAYSVLEDLGVELRASEEQPSAQPDGTWNPSRRSDLEARLRDARINLSDKFNWSQRGRPTRLESRRPRQIFRNATPAQWAHGDVRDLAVEIVDAIAYASWLRSKVSSHRSRPEDVRLLSIYDVTNVQFLARQLLLETMGFWRTHPREKAARETDGDRYSFRSGEGGAKTASVTGHGRTASPAADSS